MLAKSPADDRIRRQLVVWQNLNRLPSTLEALKPLYDSEQPAGDGLVRVLYASALLNAGKSDEARAILQRWPLPENGADQALQSIVIPKFLELRKKLQIGQ
jgi:thioredoxin-like negative regulator of GroEL